MPQNYIVTIIERPPQKLKSHQKAQEYTAKYDYKSLVQALKDAEKLQHHNSRLIKIIEQTEKRLSAIAKKVASEVKQIEK